jgi:hypothetical protein
METLIENFPQDLIELLSHEEIKPIIEEWTMLKEKKAVSSVRNFIKILAREWLTLLDEENLKTDHHEKLYHQMVVCVDNEKEFEGVEEVVKMYICENLNLN